MMASTAIAPNIRPTAMKNPRTTWFAVPRFTGKPIFAPHAGQKFPSDCALHFEHVINSHFLYRLITLGRRRLEILNDPTWIILQDVNVHHRRIGRERGQYY
jgi:hypothetical protein